jgi:subtilisin family serine protease
LHYRFITCLCLFSQLSACGIEEDVQRISKIPNDLIRASPAEVESQQVLSNSYIVTFKSEVSGNALAFPTYFAEYQAHDKMLAEDFYSDPRVKKIQFMTAIDLSNPSAFFEDEGFEPPTSLKLAWDSSRQKSIVGAITRVDFTDAQSAEELLGEWQRDSRFWFAEPNYQSTLSDETGWGAIKTDYEKLIDEDSQDKFYWLKDINAVGAYEALAGKAGTFDNQPIIAVMDTGVDVLHPKLKDHMWVNDNGVGTGNCGSNDINGCNTTAETEKGVLGDGDVAPFGAGGMGKPCPQSSGGGCSRNCCHGTHVSGIIAASLDASNEVAGVCPICRIMALRIWGETPDQAQGTILDTSIIGALKYVTLFRANKGLAVRVINASFGKFQRSRAVSILIQALKDTPQKNKGTILIGAAGNEDTNKMQYPAGYRDAIAVSNIHNTGPKHESSNFGRWVDVAAPGTAITSTVPGDRYEAKSGTSMASPVVAGVAGLVLAAYPDISISGLRSAIVNGANADVIYDNSVNKSYLVTLEGENNAMPLLGSGMVDAKNAVELIKVPRSATASLNRVDDSCGLMGGETKNAPLSFLLLFLPLIFCVRIQTRSRTGS